MTPEDSLKDKPNADTAESRQAAKALPLQSEALPNAGLQTRPSVLPAPIDPPAPLAALQTPNPLSAHQQEQQAIKDLISDGTELEAAEQSSFNLNVTVQAPPSQPNSDLSKGSPKPGLIFVRELFDWLTVFSLWAFVGLVLFDRSWLAVPVVLLLVFFWLATVMARLVQVPGDRDEKKAPAITVGS